MKRIAAAVAGGLTYLAFAGSLFYMMGFLLDAGVPKSVDRGAGPLGPTLLIDLSLIAAFGLQHSLMARPGFKRWLTRRVHPELERMTYVFASTVILWLIFWLWRPVPLVLWDVHGSVGRAAIVGLYAFGWVIILLSSFALSHARLFGLTQLSSYWRGRRTADLGLEVRPLLYRLVRHPMTAAIILVLWATPRMTAGHLLFAIGMTAYSLVGTWFEERDLIRAYGQSYREYMARVPGFVPRPNWLRGARRRWATVTGLAVGAFALPLAVGTGFGGGADASTGPAATVAFPAFELEYMTIPVDGLDRRVGYYAPASAGPGAPLVLAFHGTDGSPERMRTLFGETLERAAERGGFLLAYPEAYDGGWNDCRARNPAAAKRLDVDDVGFVRAVVERLAAERGVNRNRVFALGLSGGGQMVFRLALEGGVPLRAAAAFAANLPVDDQLDCEVGGSVPPTLIVNGTEDLLSPYDGGDTFSATGVPLGRARSSEATARFFAAARQQTGEPVEEVVVTSPEGAPVVRRTFWGPSDRYEVVLYSVIGGGHTVPGPHTRFPDLVGRTERRWDGVAAAVGFGVGGDGW